MRPGYFAGHRFGQDDATDPTVPADMTGPADGAVCTDANGNPSIFSGGVCIIAPTSGAQGASTPTAIVALPPYAPAPLTAIPTDGGFVSQLQTGSMIPDSVFGWSSKTILAAAILFFLIKK